MYMYIQYTCTCILHVNVYTIYMYMYTACTCIYIVIHNSCNTGNDDSFLILSSCTLSGSVNIQQSAVTCI